MQLLTNIMKIAKKFTKKIAKKRHYKPLYPKDLIIPSLKKGLSGNDSDKKAKFQPRGLRPKIDSIIEKQNILTKSQSQNALYLSGYFYFVL